MLFMFLELTRNQYKSREISIVIGKNEISIGSKAHPSRTPAKYKYPKKFEGVRSNQKLKLNPKMTPRKNVYSRKNFQFYNAEEIRVEENEDWNVVSVVSVLKCIGIESLRI